MKKNLSDIARIAGLAPYPSHAVSSVSDIGAAVRNVTAGRTHYYEKETMRFFHCRVLRARIFCDGVVLGTVCAQAGDMHNRTRVYRIAFHDLTGRTLNNRPEGREDYATRAAADKAFNAYAAGLDGGKILGDAIRCERDRALREVKAARVALRRFRGTLA